MYSSRTTNVFLVERVFYAPLHQYGHGLVHSVTYHTSNQRTRGGLRVIGIHVRHARSAYIWLRSLRTVFSLATSRRNVLIWLGRDSCPIPFCIRRLKASRRISINSLRSSSLLLALSSRAFIKLPSELRTLSAPATLRRQGEMPRGPSLRRRPASRIASDPAERVPPNTLRCPYLYLDAPRAAFS